ncbi:antitoxin of toxin-antitoxin stability system [Tabrizicola oligotrophica]|uniref:Antitoxin of toxin-antitoxin stability system n=1 Tax=Tabrizicola oligotrophica TaxID=2710650 RepID=A0A6M0QXD8_9RHOB|nr:antitoxin of toxin-antitoxin stability system [Tabrizicola oligotrophica]NEY92166.1 antitoxin of toxin-antitoxin stability system [Tabrizicola oligotrophica]
MPEVICTTVYSFPELSDAAKERARDWYRELGPHDDWWDAVYDDFERICEILGLRLKTTPVRLMGGGTRQKPCIWFSGFWSQGDGACFEGWLSHAKGAAARIRYYAPRDVTLHGIADRLQAIQRRNFYQIVAEASHRGRYYHEYTMSVDVSRDSPTCQPPTEDAEETVVEIFRDLARWLYRQFQTEYDHLTSDEAIEEGIIVNEYTFTEAGRRFG